jgi:hypothetical protein
LTEGGKFQLHSAPGHFQFQFQLIPMMADTFEKARTTSNDLTKVMVSSEIVVTVLHVCRFTNVVSVSHFAGRCGTKYLS